MKYKVIIKKTNTPTKSFKYILNADHWEDILNFSYEEIERLQKDNKIQDDYLVITKKYKFYEFKENIRRFLENLRRRWL